MSFLRIYSFLCLLIISACKSGSQTQASEGYKLIVNLENAPFDSLFLNDYTEGRDVLFVGKKIQDFTWEFTLPDSIVEDSENMKLMVSPYDFITNSSRMVRFTTEKNGKKIIVANVGVEDRTNYIQGTYIGESVFPNDPIHLKLDNKDSVIVGNLVVEDFKLIVQDEQSDIAVRAEDPFFSWFDNFDGEKMTYNDLLESYVKLAEKHPDSRFLMTNLASNLSLYRSEKDIQAVYQKLSGKHKNSLQAKNIERFLSGKFENSSLPTLNKAHMEDLVQDTSKYNFIIFSASWCGYCMDELPLLKEIHEDLGKHLIFTYVSIDEEKSVPAFQKIAREKDIYWRTLLAYREINKIKQKYFINGIPLNILVYPNGDTERLDVRVDSNRAKLYAIVNSYGN